MKIAAFYILLTTRNSPSKLYDGELFFITYCFDTLLYYRNYVVLLIVIMTVVNHFKVAFSNNYIGYKRMHANYIFATAAKKYQNLLAAGWLGVKTCP